MNYLIAGLAKSGTTMLFSRLLQAMVAPVETFFEPDQAGQLADILKPSTSFNTLTKVLIGRVLPGNEILAEFDKHVVIYRDPRDQFISMLLYLFYDFQLSGDKAAYDKCYAALTKKQADPAAHSAIELYDLIASAVGRAPVAVFDNLHRVQRTYIEAFRPFRACYEDLLDGKWSELESYLDLPLGSEAEVPREYQRVVRSKGYGDWRNWLNDSDIEYTNKHWGKSLVELGYELGKTGSGQVISLETTIGYVSQFDPHRVLPSP